MPREVAVGLVRKAFGLGGDVFVHPDPDLDDAFPVGARYRTSTAAGTPGPELRVAASVLHRGLRVVRFDAAADRSAAEGLRDLVLLRDVEDADLDGDADAEAHWADELVGRPVVGPGGEQVGAVTGLLDGPAHDYLVVTTPDGREVLVPAVTAFVTVEADRVVLTPIPGLLDAGEEA